MFRISFEQRDLAFIEISKFSETSVLLLVFVQITIGVITWIYLSAKGGKAHQGVLLLWEEYSSVLFLRLLTAVSGAILIVLSRSTDMISMFLLFPMMLIIISEFLGRWLFYSMYQREGI
jgi:DMSO reductase anchor subunit